MHGGVAERGGPAGYAGAAIDFSLECWVRVWWSAWPPGLGENTEGPSENALFSEWPTIAIDPEAQKSGDGESIGEGGGEMDW